MPRDITQDSGKRFRQVGPTDAESSQIQRDKSSKGGKLSYIKPGADTAPRNVDEDSGDRFKKSGPTDPQTSQIQR